MSRGFGLVWLLLQPGAFTRELDLLARLGDQRHASQLQPELDGYAYENDRDRPLRVTLLGVRISRRRCLRIFQEIMR